MIAQTENTLQANRTQVETPVGSGKDNSPSFGSALAKAANSGAHPAAHASAGTHPSKKPADKKEDASSSASSKGDKAAQTVGSQPSLPASTKVSGLAFTLQPAANGEPTQGDGEAASEGSGESAVSGLNRDSNIGGAAGAADGAARQGASSVTAGSSKADEKRPVIAHMPAATQIQNASVDQVGAEPSDAQEISSEEVSSISAAGDVAADADADVDVDGASVGSGMAPGSDGDAAAMLGIVLPTAPPLVFDASISGPELESAVGLGVNSNGLSAGTAASKSSLGGSSEVAKPKGGNSDATPVTQPGSFEKTGTPVAAPTPALGLSANGAVVTAQVPVHGGGAGNGSSQTESKGTQHGSGGDNSAAALTTSAPQSWDASATQVVHRAQLIQAMHQSEMRMGMNSAEFGNISISAAVSHQTLSAQISVEHAELSSALTAHLPAIEKQLGNAYGLQSRVEVRDGSSTAQQGSSRRDGERSQGSMSAASSAAISGLGSAGGLPLESLSPATYSPAAGMRLDILV